MPDPLPISAPAGYVVPQALAFAGIDGAAQLVNAAHPLPIVGPSASAASSTPLTGTTSASATPGPFAPDIGRTIWIALSGTWTGSVQLLRSTDGGATRLPLTVGGQPWAIYTANACEPIGEESVAGASYWLAITISSGTLAYQVRQ